MSPISKIIHELKEQETPLFVKRISEATDPLLDILKRVVYRKTLPNKWDGPKLTKPVSHIVDADTSIKSLKDLTFSKKMDKIIELAFQLGACQGYSMAKRGC